MKTLDEQKRTIFETYLRENKGYETFHFGKHSSNGTYKNVSIEDYYQHWKDGLECATQMINIDYFKNLLVACETLEKCHGNAFEHFKSLDDFTNARDKALETLKIHFQKLKDAYEQSI